MRLASKAEAKLLVANTSGDLVVMCGNGVQRKRIVTHCCRPTTIFYRRADFIKFT
jgi:hypothetical protein